jgi:hypothetical protein
MKNAFFLSISVSLFLLASMSNAHPANFTLTDSLGEEKEVFAFDETPWLKVNLKSQDISMLGWWKVLPDGAENVISEGSLAGGNTYSWPLSNWAGLRFKIWANIMCI